MGQGEQWLNASLFCPYSLNNRNGLISLRYISLIMHCIIALNTPYESKISQIMPLSEYSFGLLLNRKQIIILFFYGQIIYDRYMKQRIVILGLVPLGAGPAAFGTKPKI